MIELRLYFMGKSQQRKNENLEVWRGTYKANVSHVGWVRPEDPELLQIVFCSVCLNRLSLNKGRA